VATETIEIVSPLGVRASKKTGLARRSRNSLQGARVGLLDNNKPNADKFLAFVGALLESRHADIVLVSRRKMSRTGAEFLPELITRCDVVINAFAD
jgi:hypothetical protein